MENTGINKKVKFFKIFLFTIIISGIINICTAENLDYISWRLINLEQSINNTEKDFHESPLRRFEIIFFISMPVTFILSVGGTLLYKQFSNNRGNFNNMEYRYIILSSVGISFTVALRDYIYMSKKSE